MKNLTTRRNVKYRNIVIYNILASYLSLLLVVLLQNSNLQFLINNMYALIGILLGITVTYYALYFIFQLTRIHRYNKRFSVFLEVFKINVLCGLLLLAFNISFQGTLLSNYAILLFISFSIFLQYFIYYYFVYTFKIIYKGVCSAKKIILVGGREIDEFLKKLENRNDYTYQIVSIISSSDYIKSAYEKDYKIYPTTINLKSILQIDIVDELICFDDALSFEKIDLLADFCNQTGVIFNLNTREVESISRFRKTKNLIFSIPFYTVGEEPNRRYSYVMKNIFEILFVSYCIFILSPIMLTIAFILLVTNKNTAVIKEKRVGMRGRKFYLYSFKTFESTNGNIVTLTRFGKFLTKYNLEKLPHLFSILHGDMALVGPRPQLPSDVEKYKKWYYKRLSVKPGLICDWQLLPRSNKNKLEKNCNLDIQYIEDWKLRKDIALIFKSFKTILIAR